VTFSKFGAWHHTKNCGFQLVSRKIKNPQILAKAQDQLIHELIILLIKGKRF